MVMQGRRLLRTQVIAWNDPWSARDRVWVAAALDAIPSGVCVLPASGDRIGVWVGGRRALIIYPGYLVWPGGRWTKDLPQDLFPDMQGDGRDQWHGLSTFQHRDP